MRAARAGLKAAALAAGRAAARRASRRLETRTPEAPRPRRSGPDARPTGGPTGGAAGPADPHRVQFEYSPAADGDADPGEVVWTWVAYEEDPNHGKDRPVLVVGRDSAQLLGLMLTSKDHDRDAEDEARWGRYWMDLGSGDWDDRGRPSEVRLDRILRVDPGEVRREGAILDRDRFDRVAAEVRRLHGW